MSSAKRLSIASIRKLVEKHGGTLEHNGDDDYDAISPIGYWWKEAEVRVYPLPLGECESPADRQELLRQAVDFLAEIEPYENDDRINQQQRNP